MLGIVIANVFPIDPVEPAVGQFHGVVADHDAIFGEQPSFRSDLHCEHIGFVRTNKFRDIELKTVVHADYLRRISDLVAIEPDVCPIVNTFENE